MKKDAVKFIFAAMTALVFFTGTIALVILGIRGIGSNLVQIESGMSVFLFALATFGWIIPLQLLSVLRMIPIQKRRMRMIFPYAERLFQVSIFVLYLLGLNMVIPAVNFSSAGMIAFAGVMVLLAKVLFMKINAEARKVRRRELEKQLSRD
ncbi:hypothetical protein CR205_12740 [Alteribacter lacisalsi]|uniref:Uncharacterized protein n=1 Tax=Alteribacter lacisalsi TaxID=2045244 RepID=A0A2W0H410_9BACI|nr:hypothetical protein [Alteribacter lacisalsi]PYZ96573.1 hypothetical protein CR205_12740 [Alteribacter lacisalsi]